MIGGGAVAARASHGLGRTARRLLAGGACLAALLAAARPAWCGWQTFGLTEGLPALHITSIAEDRDENLWFASSAGVSRYDGAAFRNLDHAAGLVSDDVRAVLADRAGRLWFGTAGGVSRYDHGAWTNFTSADGLADNQVRAILEDHLGRLWFATLGGASRFDGANWTTYQQVDGLAANQLTCLYEDRAGTLWFGTDGGGLSRFDGTTWTTYTTVSTSNGLAGDNIASITQTRDGAIWIGTRYFGLSRFDGATWTKFSTAGTLGLGDVTALAEDADGILWAGTGVGVARWDGRAWRSYTTADGLAGNMVAALILDRSGSRWIATDGGVSRYDGESWTAYGDVGLATYGAQAVIEDASGSIWAGTSGAGVARWDRSAWTSLTVASTSGGLASDVVAAVLEDSSGAMWFGTSLGASRFDGASWRTFTTTDGLVGNNVGALARDSSGGVWIGTTAGLSRYEGAGWSSYTTANGLPANRVRALLVDRAGRLWCGTTAGVAMFSAGTWTRYSTADGLAGQNVYAILEDHAGAMWFGTTTGLSRFDGATWRNYTSTDGLAEDWVLSMAETPDSVLWIGTANSGVSRFDGSVWRTSTTQDGLPDSRVSASWVERAGNLWFATRLGVVLYEPARVPPQTVITSPPPPLSANTLQTVHFVAAHRQVLGIEFSTALDSAPWSPWGPEDTWIGRDLLDGVHVLRVRARDALHHVDPTPATCTFEVAATPPAPVITEPVFRQPVRDTLVVSGTAEALRFRSFRVDLRPADATSWDPPVATPLAQSLAPVADGILARFDTRPLADGDYEIRLAVQDTLGLTGVARVRFIVDNVAPWAAQTTPARVSAFTGGDVFTTHSEAHLYIPPRGLPRDAIVHLDPLDPADVPAVLPDGATRLSPGYDVEAEGTSLEKSAVLDLSLAGLTVPAGSRPTLYALGSDALWHHLGGTLDANRSRIATPIDATGRYAIFARSAGAEASGPISLSLTPRVLASRGAIASSAVRIGFVLARPSSVRVTIHNRAGRLVRVVISGQTLGAGTNLVSWDGRDDDHHDVEAGLYLVTVEALGETHTQTLAVVR